MPPPPPPPLGGTSAAPVKLKTLHWTKIQANKLKGSLWQESMEPPPGVVDLESLHTLFQDARKDATAGSSKRPGKRKETVQLVDQRRGQSIGIMLSRFKTPLETVARGVERMDARLLGADEVMALRAYLPNDDEVSALKAYTGDPALLGAPELYLMRMMAIPLVSHRLDSFHFLLTFDQRVTSLRKAVSTVSSACDRILSSKHLRAVLAIVLEVGNSLNNGTFAGAAKGFRLASLHKLQDIKSTDGKTTLQAYLVKRMMDQGGDGLGIIEELGCADEASKHLWSELDRDLGEVFSGMAKTRALTEGLVDDSILVEVISAFMERTRGVPEELETSLRLAKEAYSRTALLLVEDESDADAPGSLFRMISEFVKRIKRERDAVEKAKAEEKERRERLEQRAEAERAKKRAAAAARLAAKARQQQAAAIKGSPAAIKGSTAVARGVGRSKKDGAAAAAMSMTDINDAVLEVMSPSFFHPKMSRARACSIHRSHAPPGWWCLQTDNRSHS